jgi:hypothetical protein
MTGNQSYVTYRFAQFIAGSQWKAIPPEVRKGVRGLLNFVDGKLLPRFSAVLS